MVRDKWNWSILSTKVSIQADFLDTRSEYQRTWAGSKDLLDEASQHHRTANFFKGPDVELTASHGGLEQTAHFRISGHVSQDRVGILESLILILLTENCIYIMVPKQTKNVPKTQKSI